MHLAQHAHTLARRELLGQTWVGCTKPPPQPRSPEEALARRGAAFAPSRASPCHTDSSCHGGGANHHHRAHLRTLPRTAVHTHIPSWDLRGSRPTRRGTRS